MAAYYTAKAPNVELPIAFLDHHAHVVGETAEDGSSRLVALCPSLEDAERIKALLIECETRRDETTKELHHAYEVGEWVETADIPDDPRTTWTRQRIQLRSAIMDASGRWHPMYLVIGKKSGTTEYVGEGEIRRGE